MGQPGQSEQLVPPPPVNKNLPHTWTTMRQLCYGGKAEMWSVRAMHTFSCTAISGAMLQCYVLTCGRGVTAFSAPPRSRRPGQGPRSPHPKAGPVYTIWKWGTFVQPLLKWKSNKYYPFCVCVCSIRYLACNDQVPYCHMSPLWLHNIFPHYLVNGMIPINTSYLLFLSETWVFLTTFI
jgi:hypothetical protein